MHPQFWGRLYPSGSSQTEGKEMISERNTGWGLSPAFSRGKVELLEGWVFY